MKYFIPVFCLLFLLSACSGSRYYFNKRVHPSEPETTLTSSFEHAQMVNGIYPVLTIPAREEAPVVKDQVPVQGEKTAVVPAKKMILPMVHSRPTALMNAPQEPSFSIKTIAGTKKMNPLAIFFIVIGGIELLTLVIALLLGATLVEALLAMAIVLGLLVLVMAYTALNAW